MVSGAKVTITRVATGQSQSKTTNASGEYTFPLIEIGEYTVRVEVHREHGKHVRQSGKIELGGGAKSVTFAKNEETGETVVSFGQAEAKE